VTKFGREGKQLTLSRVNQEKFSSQLEESQHNGVPARGIAFGQRQYCNVKRLGSIIQPLANTKAKLIVISLKLVHCSVAHSLSRTVHGQLIVASVTGK